MNKIVTFMLAGTMLSGIAAAPVAAQEADIEALRAEMAALRAEVAALKAELDMQDNGVVLTDGDDTVGPAEPVSPTEEKTVTPELQASSGWSFKPRGRLMYDVANVSGPDGLVEPGLGFSNELRRGRLGASGDLPGGFGYKAELEFAEGDAEFTDAILTYENGGFEATLGQHNNFQGLEELSSSLHTSFIERAAFTDAFGFERRVGLSVQYGAGDILAQAGIFTDNIADLDDANNSNGADARIVYVPTFGDTQLHLGGSIHYRALNDAASSVRYRQRPAVHSTDLRFVNTGSIGATSETGYGLEAAAIAGRFHVAAETYWQAVGGVPGDNPTFFGGYLEGGVFFTDDTRGYKGGKFDRVKPTAPLGAGGWGSLQLNARYDYLDLNDAGIIGGVQNAYQTSLIWKPVDTVLFGLNYARLVYDDAALATLDGDRDYAVDTVALRGQVDF